MMCFMVLCGADRQTNLLCTAVFERQFQLVNDGSQFTLVLVTATPLTTSHMLTPRRLLRRHTMADVALK